MSDNILTAQRISKQWGDRTLFFDLNFGISTKQKLAFLGANGCGKSTLLKILAGIETDYEGEVVKRKDLVVHYQSQEASIPDNKSIIEYLMMPYGEAGKAVLQYHSAIAAGDYEDISVKEKQLQNHNAQNLYSEVISLAGQLELSVDTSMTDSLSGGQLKKIQLVEALIGDPDLLILDEPTNHLDEITIKWLENKLIRFNGTLILVTHDRYFLDRIVDNIIEIWHNHIHHYEGNYQTYLEKKEELIQTLEAEEAKRKSFLKKEIEWIRRGPKARGTKAKYRIEKFNEIQNKDAFKQAKTLDLKIKQDTRLGKSILKIRSLCKAFDNKTLIHNFDLDLRGGDRIGLLGPNGCGKSTLLKMVMEQIKPDSGTIKVGLNTKFAYFDQKRETLDDDKTVFDSIGTENDFVEFQGSQIHKSSLLDSMLFDHHTQRNKIKHLSGGEKNRLQLLQVMTQSANFLILDEPTNDLDITSLEILEENLTQFTGCALLVSHDRFFLDQVATSLIIFKEDGHLHHFEGNYADYQDWERLQKKKEEEYSKSKSVQSSEVTSEESKPKKLSYMEQKEFETIEKTIAEQEEQLEKLEAELSEASSNSDFEQVQSLNEKYEAQKNKIEKLYERWDYLNTKHEAYLEG